MEQTGRVAAVSISEAKGTPKNNIQTARLLEDWGIDGDAHAGSDTHRQVSLLAVESIEKIRAKGLDVAPGAFAENITTQFIDITSLKIGDRIRIADTELEITQIGKECHNRCAIYYQAGDCIMPKEGVFAKVLKGGDISVGDSVRVVK